MSAAAVGASGSVPPTDAPPKIERAEPGDAAGLRLIAEEAFAPYTLLIGRRPAPMDADFDAHIARGEAWVARSGRPRQRADANEILGYLILIPEADAMLLDAVATSAAARGAGVGRALLIFAEEEARRRGARAITLYTNVKMSENLALYPRAGYVETGRRTVSGFERAYFRKTLPQTSGSTARRDKERGT